MKEKVSKIEKWSYSVDDLNFYAPEPPLLTAIYVVVKNNITGVEYGYSLDTNGIHGHDDLGGEVPYALIMDDDYNGNYPTQEDDREIRANINISSVFWDYVKQEYKLSENIDSQFYLNECERKN